MDSSTAWADAYESQEAKVENAARPVRPTDRVLIGRAPPLAVRLLLITALILAVLALIAAALGTIQLFPFLTVLAVTLAIHLGGAALMRRGARPEIVDPALRLLNLAACTLIVILFDGLYSPLIPLYTQDILSASLRDGRRGAWKGWGLVTAALVVVALQSWPLVAAETVRFLVYVGVMGIVALIAGELGQRRIALQLALAQQTLESKQLYAALEEQAQRVNAAYEELKDLDRRKTEFVQSISHELRTPLLFIRGYTELMRDGGLGELTDLQREKLDLVANKSHLLADLIRDVVSLQRGQPQPEEMREVSLAEMARQAVASAEAMAHEQGIKIHLDCPAALFRIQGTARRLEEVFDNLLSNAIKFSPDGGTITVRARREDGAIVVSVADEGIGVPPEEQERIFERFYRVDNATTHRSEGTGLGLAIVKEIVEGHGGRVWLESPTLPGEPGHGSTFYFSLPQSVIRGS